MHEGVNEFPRLAAVVGAQDCAAVTDDEGQFLIDESDAR